MFALADGFVAFKLFEAGTTRWLVLGAAALPAIYVGGGVLAAKLGVHYRLTTQRLFIREGILTRTLSEVELVRVDDVTVRQGLIQRLFGVGDVLLASTDRSSGAIEIAWDRPADRSEGNDPRDGAPPARPGGADGVGLALHPGLTADLAQLLLELARARQHRLEDAPIEGRIVLRERGLHVRADRRQVIVHSVDRLPERNGMVGRFAGLGARGDRRSNPRMRRPLKSLS